MEIYIEYAFIENFALDLVLGYLAFAFARVSVKKNRLVAGAVVGAVFAVAYPFFKAFSALAFLFKIGFPFLACSIGFGGKILKKDRGRYALTVACYYAASFVFAGATYAVCAAFEINYAVGDGIYVGVPIGTLCAVFVFTVAWAARLARAIYSRRLRTRFIYPCELRLGDKHVMAQGYLDSGNLAEKSGSPVCFLSAGLFFELFGERAFGRSDDELELSTVSGKKRTGLFLLDDLKIYFGRAPNIIEKPYCAPSAALTGKEYEVLLGAWAADELNKTDRGEDDGA